MADATQENLKSKAPKLKGDSWLFYQLRMTTYLGRDGMRCLVEERPAAMDNLSAEDQEAFNATLGAGGRETAMTRAWERTRETAIASWDETNAKNHRALVESCEDNPTAELICLKISQEVNATAATLWRALCKRYNDGDKVTTTHEIGIFNTMSVESGETRGQWIDRLSKQIISIEGRGRQIDEETLVERLLSGLNSNPLYKAEGATIQLLANNNWDRVTSLLTSYDKRDKEAKSSDSANFAGGSSSIICHECGEKGHKRPECPKRGKSRNGKNKNPGRKGGGGSHGGDKSRNKFVPDG
jgi:hypothetical protein